MFDPRLRFHGPVAAIPRLGDPRVVGLAFLAIVAAAFLIGVIAGAIDLGSIGFLALAGGPLMSVDLKEQAFAKFTEAQKLEGEDGTVAAEDEERYNALVAEAIELDRQAGAAAVTEGSRTSLHERLSEYNERATGMPMVFNRTSLDPRANMSLGQQFVASETYRRLVESGALNTRGASFRTDPVVAFAPRGLQMRAAASDVIHTGDGGSSPGPALRLPGVYEYGRPPLGVRDLFVNDTLGNDSVEYVAQTARDAAASPLTVEQSSSATDAAGLKKQSSIAWQVQTAYAEIIATWFAITRKALGQSDTVRSFIDNQGRLILALEEEEQLINGNGTRPNLSGLLDQSARLTLDVASTVADNLDGIRRAKRLVKSGLSRLGANWLLVNPEDSEGFDLLKDDFGQYRGGNPIGGGFAEDQLPIWRLRRVESEGIAAGTAIVGARAAATVFQRRPLTVLTADQHSDFFVRNLVVILFEEELAFPVYFPTAICEITLQDWGLGS